METVQLPNFTYEKILNCMFACFSDFYIGTVSNFALTVTYGLTESYGIECIHCNQEIVIFKKFFKNW